MLRPTSAPVSRQQQNTTSASSASRPTSAATTARPPPNRRNSSSSPKTPVFSVPDYGHPTSRYSMSSKGTRIKSPRDNDDSKNHSNNNQNPLHKNN